MMPVAVALVPVAIDASSSSSSYCTTTTTVVVGMGVGGCGSGSGCKGSPRTCKRRLEASWNLFPRRFQGDDGYSTWGWEMRGTLGLSLSCINISKSKVGGGGIMLL
jgi:hypothetical protein